MGARTFKNLTMKREFSPEELKNFFTGKHKDYFAEEAQKKEEEMRIHADGCYPECLIGERRPNEPDEVRKYRKEIWQPKTKPYFSKIESALQKIRKSSDWSIKYPVGSFDRIVDGEKLEDYCEKKYPSFTSVTNWAFSVLLRNYLIDPNAVLLTVPTEFIEGEFVKPVGMIFNSSDVITYEDDDFCVLRNKSGVKGKDGWESYFVVTKYYVRRYDQINNRKQFSVAFEYPLEFEVMPAQKLSAIIVDVYGNQYLSESRISGILPEFNEALREYSDLQAAKVLHLHPERWEYTQNECTVCKGTGQIVSVKDNLPCTETCNSCQGGYVASGPFSKMLLKPATADQHQLPTPPAGYVEKDVRIIELQEQSVKDHIFNGLASINFEFIATVQLNQSGIAKEVDRDELNTTVHAIAEDIIRILDRHYFFIALYRYSYQYSKTEIDEMLPKIAVPEKFDILNTNYYYEMVKGAKDAKLNPAILNAMEVSYATKAFNNDSEISTHVALILKLDPLAGVSEDDKNSRLQNDGITRLDYIVSSNINKFVDILTEENPDFYDWDVKDQREEVYKLAEEQLNEENNNTDTEEIAEVREEDTIFTEETLPRDTF